MDPKVSLFAAGDTDTTEFQSVTVIVIDSSLRVQALKSGYCLLSATKIIDIDPNRVFSERGVPPRHVIHSNRHRRHRSILFVCLYSTHSLIILKQQRCTGVEAKIFLS